MAWIISWCMTCEAQGKDGEYGRQQDANLQQNERSHGYCDPHAVEYIASVREQIAERKRQLQSKGQTK